MLFGVRFLGEAEGFQVTTATFTRYFQYAWELADYVTELVERRVAVRLCVTRKRSVLEMGLSKEWTHRDVLCALRRAFVREGVPWYFWLRSAESLYYGRWLWSPASPATVQRHIQRVVDVFKSIDREPRDDFDIDIYAVAHRWRQNQQAQQERIKDHGKT